MAEENPDSIGPRELYKVLIDTRNQEINLFWQRSNYFLVLNTAIAVGFVHIEDGKPIRLVLAFLGFAASVLWFGVCLGGKYWQTRWEQRLLEFEEENLPRPWFFRRAVGSPPTRCCKWTVSFRQGCANQPRPGS